MVLLGVTGPTQEEMSFTHCPLPVGSSLPGMMEANEVSQCCATGGAAEKLWELWGEKKTGEQEEKSLTGNVGGRKFDRDRGCPLPRRCRRATKPRVEDTRQDHSAQLQVGS